MALSPLLRAYDHVLLDLDGCVWVGDRLVPGSHEALTELRSGGKGLSVVAHGGARAPEEYVRKLWAWGLQASLEEVVTVGGAIQYVLAGRRPGTPAFVI